jgi:hypothetical protein
MAGFPTQVIGDIEFWESPAHDIPAWAGLEKWVGGVDKRYTGDGAGTIRLFPFVSLRPRVVVRPMRRASQM